MKGQEPLCPISSSYQEYHWSSFLLTPCRLPGRLVAPTMRLRHLTPGYFRVLQVSASNSWFLVLTPSSPYCDWVVCPNSLGNVVTFPAASAARTQMGTEARGTRVESPWGSNGGHISFTQLCLLSPFPS